VTPCFVPSLSHPSSPIPPGPILWLPISFSGDG
jgi:hypothetical protein